MSSSHADDVTLRCVRCCSSRSQTCRPSHHQRKVQCTRRPLQMPSAQSLMTVSASCPSTHATLLRTHCMQQSRCDRVCTRQVAWGGSSRAPGAAQLAPPAWLTSFCSSSRGSSGRACCCRRRSTCSPASLRRRCPAVRAPPTRSRSRSCRWLRLHADTAWPQLHPALLPHC